MGVRDGVEAGKAFIRMRLDDEDMAKDLEGVATNMSGMAATIAKSSVSLGAFSAGILAPFIAAARGAQTFGRQLAFSSDRLGIAASEMQVLTGVAETFGVTMEGVEIGIKTLGERVVQLEQGSSNTAYALKQLGINARDFLKANTIDKFFMVAEGLSKIDDASRRSGLGLALLGEAGFQLQSFMAALGRGDAQKAIERFRDIRVSNDAVASVVRVNTELQLMTKTLQTQLLELFRTFASDLEAAFYWMGKLTAKTTELIKENPLLARFVFYIGSLAALSAGILAFAAGIAKMAASLGLSRIAAMALIPALKTVIGLVIGLATASAFTPVFWMAVIGGFLATGKGAFYLSRAVGVLIQGIGTLVVWLLKIPDALGLISDGFMRTAKEVRDTGKVMSEWTYGEFRDAMGWNDSPDRAPTAGGSIGGLANIVSAGILGGTATQQTLGLAGATSPQQAALDTISENTKSSADTLQRIEQKKEVMTY